ncbi:MAG: hypothetical protein QGG50_08340 [Methanopyri archaeon]|jgi:hypothetical protein|nr:hypothetical protein [Methanopyri archaeon]
MSCVRTLFTFFLLFVLATAQGVDDCALLSPGLEQEHCYRIRAPPEGRVDLCLTLSDDVWLDECLAEVAPVLARTNAQTATGTCRLINDTSWREWCHIDTAAVVAGRDMGKAWGLCSSLPYMFPWGTCVVGVLAPQGTIIAILITLLVVAVVALRWRRRGAGGDDENEDESMDEVREYVEECRAKGLTDKEIKSTMKEFGYSRKEIERVL